MQYLNATTFGVVHYIVLQAVHYKPLQEVHLSRYNHLSNEDIASVGKVILHKKFGSGSIASIDGDNVMVNFGTETVKLNYKFALGKGIIETKK